MRVHINYYHATYSSLSAVSAPFFFFFFVSKKMKLTTTVRLSRLKQKTLLPSRAGGYMNLKFPLIEQKGTRAKIYIYVYI